MADANSTSSNETLTESQLAEKFPCNENAFSVWFCQAEGVWVVNDEDGNSLGDIPCYENAAKIADALKVSASVSIRHPHESLMSAATLRAEVDATTDHIADLFLASSYFWSDMNAFFEFVEREIEDQNSTDLDGIAFLVKGAKVSFFNYSKLVCKTEEALEKRCSTSGLGAEESRSGAMACMGALRAIERITEIENKGDLSMDAWWAMQDDCANAMLNAAGTPSVFMAGFISVFAEYAFTLNNSGHPALDQWKPEATMTKEEKADHRAAFTKRVEEGEKIAA